MHDGGGGGLSWTKEFLGDNVLLLQHILDISQAGTVPTAAQPLLANSHMREVTDPLTWTSCFLAFMAVKSDNDETRKLAAYGMIILQFVASMVGTGGFSMIDSFCCSRQLARTFSGQTSTHL